eukprot:TRINITY_DN5658_c0_g1_i2.p1 TRINITY_DN5658_c0_g1~~TRINITY_DN5658_c0_g1_i2.p1  ORF type:complete len:638 (+),score=115.08 TRINITY_DN5658_c0_g1_i2:39-1952(+)
MLDVAAPEIITVDDADNFYLLISGYLVFFMQCGFAMLSAGSVRQKNTMNIILKNLLDACFGAIGWYLTGYAFAYGNGNDTDPFIGGREYYALSYTHEYKESNEVGATIFASWFFQYTFAATAATIVSGAVAERTRFEAYLAYAFLLTAWVYPVIVHWVWDSNGWLNFESNKIGYLNHGMIDFAGCGVVHMTGGFAGMWGAAVVGPRIGRFQNGKVNAMPGHNASLAVLGVFILWFGWFGFNPGSTLGLHNLSMIASRCAVNTTLSAASATLITLLFMMILNFFETKHIIWDLIGTSNGTLAGLVGITAACAVVQPWAAVLIGSISGVVYVLSSKLVLHGMRIDDPLDAVAVHGFCGMWGLIATAAFADQYLVAEAYNGENPDVYGFFVGGDGGLLAAAMVGIVVIFSWVTVHMLPFFLIMKGLGLLRVDPEEERNGLDLSHHGGEAYPGQGSYVRRDEFIVLKRQLELIQQHMNIEGDEYHPLQGISTPAPKGGARGYSYQSPREDPLSEVPPKPQPKPQQRPQPLPLPPPQQSKQNTEPSSKSTQSKKTESTSSTSVEQTKIENSSVQQKKTDGTASGRAQQKKSDNLPISYLPQGFFTSSPKNSDASPSRPTAESQQPQNYRIYGLDSEKSFLDS